MEPKKCAASVFGALMGFDEQQPQQQAPRHLRVFSEGYEQRLASFGVLETKSRRRVRPFRMTTEDPKRFIGLHEGEDSFKSRGHRNELGDRKKTDFADSASYIALTRQNFLDEKLSSTDKLMQSLEESEDLPEVTDSMDISPRHTGEQTYISNHVENGLIVFSRTRLRRKTFSKSSHSHTLPQLIHHGGITFKDKKQGHAYSFKDLDVLNSSRPSPEQRDKPCLSSSSPISLKGSYLAYDYCKEFPSSQNRKDIALKTERNTLTYARESRRQSSRVRKKSEMSILPRHATLPNDLNCKPVKCVLKEHVCLKKEHLHSGSPLCMSHKDDITDRLSKDSQRVRILSASTLTARSRTRSQYESLRNTWFLKSEGPANWLGCKTLDKIPDKKDDNLSAAVSNVMAVKTEVVEVPSVGFKKQEHDSVPCIMLVADDDSATNTSHATFTSIQQDASARFDNEDHAVARSPNKELDSIVSMEEAYQPSPVSVLEPLFKEETLSNSESLKKLGINSRDLIMQLQLLMSESTGTNSEGPEMNVSSDDDVGEGSTHGSEQRKDLMSTFKFKDSRDFSYLVDVLTEAGFNYKNLHTGYLMLHGQEHHSISPSVFETLEKKFSEQISWRRSERKLLFDRINTGLTELFQSFVAVPEWAKPVSRRYRHLLNRETIEDELWILLDSQVKGVSKDVVDKQFGREIGWLDLGDEVDSICRKLESLLVEELVTEFDSIGI